MTLSTTSTFNISAQDLIDLSLADIGATGTADTNPNLRPHALKLLNIFIKSIDTTGVFTWRAPRRVVNMTAGQASYVLANDTYDIDQPARYTQAGSTFGSQVIAMPRDEYMALPDRTIQGIPYRYFADKGMDASGIYQVTFFLYPVPANTGDTLEVASVLKSKDLTDLSQTIDVSQKWLDAIRWGLTHSLCPSYNIPTDRMGYFRSVADEKLSEALGDDNERGDIQIVPWGYGYAYGQMGRGYR